MLSVGIKGDVINRGQLQARDRRGHNRAARGRDEEQRERLDASTVPQSHDCHLLPRLLRLDHPGPTPLWRKVSSIQ